jgi:hypothetical protein
MMRKLTGGIVGILAVSLVLTSQSVRAADQDVLHWEFTVNPTEEPVPMTEAKGDAGDTRPDKSGYGSGRGLLGDGTAEFADENTGLLSGNYGFVIGSPVWTGAYTMDVRVKVVEDVVEAAGKSMTIRNDSQQRGIKLRKADVTLINGSGPVGGPWSVDLGTDFQILRFSVNPTTVDNTASVYVWNGASFTSLGSTGLGGSGGGDPTPFPGIGIGSLAGSSTQSGKFIIDWARVDPVEARGGTGNPLPPPPLPCGSTVSPAGVQSLSGYVGGVPIPFASVDLGTTDVSNGLVDHPAEGDGTTTPTIIGGRDCRTNVDPNSDPYAYFAVDDALVFEGSLQTLTVAFDYFDSGTGDLHLDYDGTSSEWTTVPGVTLTDTNTWKRCNINLTDAYFGNRENGGADFRIAKGGGGHFYLDKVLLTGTGHGPETSYLVYNSGGTDIDWDAVEANADGTANDYAWLSLTKDPAPGLLATGAGATVTATVDTTSLAEGAYTAYVKFTDGCIATPYTEPFTYTADTSLAGQGGWVGTTSGSDTPDYMEFKIDGGTQLDLNGGGDSAVTHSVYQDLSSPVSGVVSVQVKVKLGGATNEQATFWDLWVYDSAGKAFAHWRGTQADAHARKLVGSDPGIEPQVVFTSDYKVMEMKIDTDNKTVGYYFDGALIASFSCEAGVGGAVKRIEFSRIAGAATSATDYILMDDLQVASLGYKLRRIDLNVVGCSLTGEPRAASAVGCSGTSTQSFALINNGVGNLSALTAVPITHDGDPATYPWLTLTVPDVTLAPGESAEVVATIDWSQVSGTEIASLRFGANCGESPIRDSLVDALTVTKLSNPSPQIVMYNGKVSPTNANSAGPGLSFRVFEGVLQGAVVTDDAAADKSAYEINDSASAKTKLISDPPANIVGASGATIVARVKTLAFAGSPRYGNVWIHAQDISAEVYWGGPDGILREDTRGVQVSLPQAANDQYHVIRVTTRDAGGSMGIVINVYFDEDPQAVMSITNATPVGPQTGSSPGFGFGTQGTGNTQDIYFDCIGATDLGAFAPGEEEACLGTSLVCPSSCNRPFADTDGDGDVDQADFAVFQLCYTGSGVGAPAIPSNPEYCACLDHADDDSNPATPPSSDGDIDSFDLSAFESCASGPNILADPDCGG